MHLSTYTTRRHAVDLDTRRARSIFRTTEEIDDFTTYVRAMSREVRSPDGVNVGRLLVVNALWGFLMEVFDEDIYPSRWPLQNTIRREWNRFERLQLAGNHLGFSSRLLGDLEAVAERTVHINEHIGTTHWLYIADLYVDKDHMRKAEWAWNKAYQAATGFDRLLLESCECALGTNFVTDNIKYLHETDKELISCELIRRIGHTGLAERRDNIGARHVPRVLLFHFSSHPTLPGIAMENEASGHEDYLLQRNYETRAAS